MGSIRQLYGKNINENKLRKLYMQNLQEEKNSSQFLDHVKSTCSVSKKMVKAIIGIAHTMNPLSMHFNI